MAVADIDIEIEIQETMPAQVDRRLIRQAFTNIIKNATEAIAADARRKELGAAHRTVVRRNGERVDIDVIDNGRACRRKIAIGCSSLT